MMTLLRALFLRPVFLLFALLMAPMVALAADAAPAAPAGNPLLALLFQALVPLVGAALTAVLGLAGQALRTWSAGKAQENAIAAITMKIEALVHHAEAVLRPQVQKALEDGVLSPAEAADLKAQVMALVKESAGAELAVLTSKLGIAGPVIDAIVSGLIEKAVAAMSAKATPAPAEQPSGPLVVVQGVRSNSDDPQVG